MKKRMWALPLASAVCLSLSIVCFAACGKEKEATLSTAPQAKSLTYTGSAQELVNAGAAENGTIYYKLEGGEWGTAVPTATNAGSYTVSYKVEGEEGYAGIAEATVAASIAKANLSYTAPVAKTGLTVQTTAQPLVTAGSVLGGTIEYKVGVDGGWDITVPGRKPAGRYEVFYRITPDDSVNYNAVPETSLGVVTISKPAATFTTEPALVGALETYDGTAQALIATAGVADGGTVSYKVNGGEWTENASEVKATNAGEYNVYYKIVADETHSDVPETLLGTLTVAKANLVAGTHYTAPTGKSIVVTGEAQELVNAGAFIGTIDGAKFEYKLASESEWAETIPSQSEADDYEINWRITGATNYNDVTGGTLNAVISSVSFTLPVANAALVPYTGNPQQLITHTPNPATDTVGISMKFCLTDSQTEEDWKDDVTDASLKATDAGDHRVYYRVYQEGQIKKAGSIIVNIAKADIASHTAPTAASVTAYTGEAQALIVAGSVADGTFQYSLDDGENWTDTIPSRTNAGSYTVHYKVVGDSNHNDIQKTLIGTVVIDKAQNSIAGFTVSGVTVNCNGTGLPQTYGASSPNGEVTYTFSTQEDGNYVDYATFTASPLSGETVYIKATVAASQNYLEKSEVLSVSVSHNYNTLDTSHADYDCLKCEHCGLADSSAGAYRYHKKIDEQYRQTIRLTDATPSISLEHFDNAGEISFVSASGEGLAEVTTNDLSSWLEASDKHGVVNITVVVHDTYGDHSVTVPVILITGTISSVAEWKTKIYAAADATATGCYELTADITFASTDATTTLNSAQKGFAGTLLGNGHTVATEDFSRLTGGWGTNDSLGIFGGLVDAYIKDVTFTQVGVQYRSRRYGFGRFIVRTTFDNVTVNLVNNKPVTANDSQYGPFTENGFTNCTFKNVTFNAYDSKLTTLLAGGTSYHWGVQGTTFNNCAVNLYGSTLTEIGHRANGTGTGETGFVWATAGTSKPAGITVAEGSSTVFDISASPTYAITVDTTGGWTVSSIKSLDNTHDFGTNPAALSVPSAITDTVANHGEYCLAVTLTKDSATKVVYVPVIFATKAIATKADWASVQPRGASDTVRDAKNYGYYILTADITMGNDAGYVFKNEQTNDATASQTTGGDNGFRGTLNGNGHTVTITGGYVKNGALLSIGAGATIKNITFDSQDLQGGWLYFVLGKYAVGASFQDVTISISSYKSTDIQYGAIFGAGARDCNFTNCTVNVACNVGSLFGGDSTTSEYWGLRNSTFKNCVVNISAGCTVTELGHVYDKNSTTLTTYTLASPMDGVTVNQLS